MTATDLLALAPIGVELATHTGDERWRDVSATLISGGKSNLTFELVSPAGSFVLRRPPTGALLPTAHDMAREARVQRALAGSSVPVPRIVIADAGELFGVPFYVMEKVEGHIVRDELPTGLADSSAQRHELAFGVLDVMAKLHRVEPAEVGLADFGRPAGFLARQVRRWRGQWKASRDQPIDTVESLGEILMSRVPHEARGSVLHGDYRIDNCVLAQANLGTVTAVLDWEMSTLGDPLSDLGMLLFFWRHPGERPRPVVPCVTDQPGFPTRRELVERYAARTGFDLAALDFAVALAHFKFAVILQGMHARVAADAMAGQSFGDLHEPIREIAAEGLALATGTTWTG